MELEVAIPVGPAKLSGNLSIPSDPRGIALFAHGSGSSRYSPRNLFVARQLHQTGMATLLFDLLTAAEEVTDLRSREHGLGWIEPELMQKTIDMTFSTNKPDKPLVAGNENVRFGTRARQ